MRFELRQPDEEELRSFLLTFRKFVSEREDVHLFPIHNMLEPLLTSEELRKYLREARSAWKATLGLRSGQPGAGGLVLAHAANRSCERRAGSPLDEGRCALRVPALNSRCCRELPTEPGAS
jgi:hypothetical protein